MPYFKMRQILDRDMLLRNHKLTQAGIMWKIPTFEQKIKNRPFAYIGL